MAIVGLIRIIILLVCHIELLWHLSYLEVYTCLLQCKSINI